MATAIEKTRGLDLTEDGCTLLGIKPLIAGDSWEPTFTTKANGSAIDLTGAKLSFLIKRQAKDDDSDALSSRHLVDGDIAIVGAATAGKCKVVYGEDDQATLLAAAGRRRYWCLRAQFADGSRQVLWDGAIDVLLPGVRTVKVA